MRNFKLFNLVYLYPIVVLLIQIVPSQIALLSGLSFIFGAIVFKNLRSIFLLFSGTILGHLAWAYFSIFLTNYDFSVSLSAILARLGLLAYIAFFIFWFYLSPSQAHFFNLGDFKAIIYFPLVWQGKKESIWRFILIFSLFCLLIIFVLAFNTQLSWELILFGLVFSIVNSSLEEILWRGLILTRIMDFLTPQYSLEQFLLELL